MTRGEAVSLSRAFNEGVVNCLLIVTFLCDVLWINDVFDP